MSKSDKSDVSCLLLLQNEKKVPCCCQRFFRLLDFRGREHNEISSHPNLHKCVEIFVLTKCKTIELFSE